MYIIFCLESLLNKQIKKIVSLFSFSFFLHNYIFSFINDTNTFKNLVSLSQFNAKVKYKNIRDNGKYHLRSAIN